MSCRPLFFYCDDSNCNDCNMYRKVYTNETGLTKYDLEIIKSLLNEARNTLNNLILVIESRINVNKKDKI